MQHQDQWYHVFLIWSVLECSSNTDVWHTVDPKHDYQCQNWFKVALVVGAMKVEKARGKRLGVNNIHTSTRGNHLCSLLQFILSKNEIWCGTQKHQKLNCFLGTDISCSYVTAKPSFKIFRQPPMQLQNTTLGLSRGRTSNVPNSFRLLQSVPCILLRLSTITSY